MRTARAGRPSLFVALVLGASFAASPAASQTGSVPNAVQGFSQNRDKPVQIEAASLEVREKDRVATFSGSVRVVQGDTTMRCRSLVVFYEQGEATTGVKTATPGPGGKQSVRRLEARGGVIVTQKEQVATGDNGIFDMKANSVTLLGNVTVTQGPNVIRGDRLVVDLTSGISKVESGKPGEPRPVRVLIHPGSVPGNSKDGKDKPASAIRPPLQFN